MTIDETPFQGRQWSAAVEKIVSEEEVVANGDSGTLTGYGPGSTIRAQLKVTSGVGGTLDVVIEDSLDGTTWNTIGTFTQATTVTREVINITTPFSDTLRVRWTVGGGAPDFDFEVDWAIQASNA